FMGPVLAPLIVARTVTPALCALLLRVRKVHREPFWIRALKWLQARLIVAVDRAYIFVIALLTIAVIGTAAWLPFLGGQFMPDFREGAFVVQVNSAIPGTSLEE